MSSALWCGVELGHELAVGGPGSGEVLVAFFELQAQVGGLLLEMADLLGEGVEVGGHAEAGLAPGLLAECFGGAFLELPGARVQAERAFVGGEQVGLQRGAGDARPGGVVADGGRGGLQGVDLAKKVAVPVEEAAVDPGGAGDAGGGDLGAVAAGAVERCDDALPAAGGVFCRPCRIASVRRLTGVPFAELLMR